MYLELNFNFQQRDHLIEEIEKKNWLPYFILY
jgi:hypothetical protein